MDTESRKTRTRALLIGAALILALTSSVGGSAPTAAETAADPQPGEGAVELVAKAKEFLKQFGGKGQAPPPGKTTVIGVRAGKKLTRVEVESIEGLAKVALEIQKVVSRSQDEGARKEGYLLLGSIYRTLASKSFQEALARVENEAERARLESVVDRLKSQPGE